MTTKSKRYKSKPWKFQGSPPSMPGAWPVAAHAGRRPLSTRAVKRVGKFVAASIMVLLGTAMILGSIQNNKYMAAIEQARAFLIRQNLDQTPRVPPSVDEDGILWPPSTPATDGRLLDVSYRAFQKGRLWRWWNAFTLVKDHPEVCFLQPLMWAGARFESSDLNAFHASVGSCSRDASKTMFVAPLCLRGKRGMSGHAMVLFLNTTARTLETFDPNGVVGYATGTDPEGYNVRKLYGALTSTAHQLGLKRVIQTGAPIQHIGESDAVKAPGDDDYNGYCEAWIYYYLRFKLLNPAMDATTLNRKLILSLDMGVNVVQGFINAQISRAGWHSSSVNSLSVYDLHDTYSGVIQASMGLAYPTTSQDTERTTSSYEEASISEYMQYWHNVRNQSLITEESDYHEKPHPYLRGVTVKLLKSPVQAYYQTETWYNTLNDVAKGSFVGGKQGQVRSRRTRKSQRRRTKSRSARRGTKSTRRSVISRSRK